MGNPLPLLYYEHHEPHDQTHKIPLSAHTLNNFLLCIHVVPVPLQISKHDSHEPKPNPHTAATQPAHFLEFSLLTIKRSEGNHEGAGLRCNDHELTNACIMFFCLKQAVGAVYLRWDGNGMIGLGV